HRYKTKNSDSGDSLMLSYAAGINSSGAVNTAKRELEELIRKNPDLDKNTIAVVRLMFTERGPELLKTLKGNRSLAEIGDIQKYFAINPLSLSDSISDRAVTAKDNSKLLELETKYNTRIKDDSLLLQKQNLLIEKANSRRKDAWFAGAVAVMIFLGAGFYMQYRFRKKADQDRATIELLQGEIHHRLTNNLAIIRRLVDVAGRNGSDKISLQSLQTRVSAIELLHKHLYSEKTTGTVYLQEYLNELAGSVQTTFAAEKNIDITVDAPVSVTSRIAEKIGLIVNEVITNSIKYAFPVDGKGKIKINGRGTGRNYELKIADNGTGIPRDRPVNFGLKMIAGLSKEIDGQFNFHNDNGTVFTLLFTDQKTT
ncbi:MAG: sensor histidine kinase, partial [Chitinophagaceae bacterium]